LSYDLISHNCEHMATTVRREPWGQEVVDEIRDDWFAFERMLEDDPPRSETS
jgi:hypothetical protein